MFSRILLLAVQIDGLFVSLLRRPVRLHRHFENLEQSRDLLTASIQTPWGIAYEKTSGGPLQFADDPLEIIRGREVDDDFPLVLGLSGELDFDVGTQPVTQLVL